MVNLNWKCNTCGGQVDLVVGSSADDSLTGNPSDVYLPSDGNDAEEGDIVTSDGALPFTSLCGSRLQPSVARQRSPNTEEHRGPHLAGAARFLHTPTEDV